VADETFEVSVPVLDSLRSFYSGEIYRASGESLDGIQVWEYVASLWTAPQLARERATMLRHLVKLHQRITLAHRHIAHMRRLVLDAKARGFAVATAEQSIEHSRDSLTLFEEHRSLVIGTLRNLEPAGHALA